MMKARFRFLLRNLMPTIFALCLAPPTCALGQSATENTIPTAAAVGNSTAIVPAGGAASLPSEKGENADNGSGFSFLRVVGGLGLVLSLIVFGTFAIRKYAPQYFTRKPAERNLRIVETLAMGERRSLAVIEIDDHRLLIGNTPNQITLLATLSDGGSFLADREAAAAQLPARPPQSSFKNLYEIERNGHGRSKIRIIPPDVRAKMRQLRESLEK